MAPRIERIWGSIFGQTSVARKESAEQDGSPGDKEKQEEQRREERKSALYLASPEEEKIPDRATVEKAVKDLVASEQFVKTGMKAELIETRDGIVVRLTQGNGIEIKKMSATEFVKLRDASAGDQTPRGKILDQKF